MSVPLELPLTSVNSADKTMMESATTGVGKLAIFFRLTRFQFLPLIILPASIGTALAYRYEHVFNLSYFVVALVGVMLLHLGANAIDDCYDFQNGVDEISDSIFPKDFGGWKPLPRGLISLRNAKFTSYLLLIGSITIAVYFTIVVGPWSLILGTAGVLLAVTYTAPPLKLDYRGHGFGETAILLAFGPIPVLGSFYVQTGMLTLPAFIVSLPIGITTVTILMDHDLIFYEVYVKAKKFSLAAILGRSRALYTSLFMTIFSYLIVFALIYSSVLPFWSLVAPIVSTIVLLSSGKTFGRPNEPPPYYAAFTARALLANWLFALIIALTIVI